MYVCMYVLLHFASPPCNMNMVEVGAILLLKYLKHVYLDWSDLNYGKAFYVFIKLPHL